MFKWSSYAAKSLNDSGHLGQPYLSVKPCLSRKCTFMASLRRNMLVQCWHWNRLLVWRARTCFRTLLELTKFLWQKGQVVIGFLFVRNNLTAAGSPETKYRNAFSTKGNGMKHTCQINQPFRYAFTRQPCLVNRLLLNTCSKLWTNIYYFN